MAEAELTRHRGAPEVVGVAVDLDPRHVLDAKAYFGQRGGRFGGEPLVNVVLVDPIANFACPCVQAGMETTAPKHLGLGVIEDAVEKVLAQIKLSTPPTQAFDL